VFDSTLTQDQQQEVSNFLKETFFRRVRQGYNYTKTKHQSLRCALADFTLMLRGCNGPLMSSSLFPTGITFVMNALNLSTNTRLLVILKYNVLSKKLLSFTLGLTWPWTSKLG
jgi:hypothetical protein